MRLAVTREGVRFIALLSVVGFAAYNNQNNVLYVLLSAGIASVVTCLLSGWLSLSGLVVEGTDQPDAYADVSFREAIMVRNRSKWLPATGVTVDGHPAAIPFLPAGAVARCSIGRLFRRRGLHPGQPIEIESAFPFGFFRWTRRLDARRDLVVFPRVREVGRDLAGVTGGGASRTGRRRGTSDEFFGLRDYVAGDYLRHIHWKKSAKVDGLVVREFGELEDQRRTVGLVPLLPEGTDPAEFEHLMTATASIACHLVRMGVAFRFVSLGLRLGPSASADHLRAILTHLATMAPAQGLDRTLERDLVASYERGERVLLLALDDVEPIAFIPAVQPAMVVPELRSPA